MNTLSIELEDIFHVGFFGTNIANSCPGIQNVTRTVALLVLITKVPKIMYPG